MKKNKQKVEAIFIMVITIISMGINSYSHSGRTDANGGHKDNQNKSGLGSYHYHCGGNPAHLHTNGVCPYSSSSSTSSSLSSKAKSSSSANTKSSTTNNKTTQKPTTVVATGIQINEQIESLEVGKRKTLTTTITPNDVTDKTVTWKSSDESIATVSASGEVVAKKSGMVDITAITSNNKTSTIKMNIQEEAKKVKAENSNAIKTSTPNENNTTNDVSSNQQNESNSIGGIVTLGILGAGGYWGYKRYKSSKKE